jgi:hypothetical protein
MGQNKFFHKHLQNRYETRIRQLLNIIKQKDKVIMELKRNKVRKNKLHHLEKGTLIKEK